jgi:hypothetical protein
MIESILSLTHLLLILVVALIVLGPKRLAEAAAGLARDSRLQGLALHGRTSRGAAAIQPAREPDHTPGA